MSCNGLSITVVKQPRWSSFMRIKHSIFYYFINVADYFAAQTTRLLFIIIYYGYDKYDFWEVTDKQHLLALRSAGHFQINSLKI